MKSGILILAMIMLLAPLPAAVELLGIANRAKAVSPVPCVFADREVRLELSLEGIDSPHSSVYVELFQNAGSLSMPLGKPMEVAHDLALSASVARPVETTFHLPPATAPVDLILRFSAQTVPNAPRAGLGVIRLRAFPFTLAKKISDALTPLSNGETRLVVFGSGKQLRAGLTALKIPYEDAGASLPGRCEPERIYLGDTVEKGEAQDAMDRRPETLHLAIFTQEDSLPPGFYMSCRGETKFIEVTLPVLNSLADDPSSQLVLLKIAESFTTG